MKVRALGTQRMDWAAGARGLILGWYIPIVTDQIWKVPSYSVPLAELRSMSGFKPFLPDHRTRQPPNQR